MTRTYRPDSTQLGILAEQACQALMLEQIPDRWTPSGLPRGQVDAYVVRRVRRPGTYSSIIERVITVDVKHGGPTRWVDRKRWERRDHPDAYVWVELDGTLIGWAWHHELTPYTGGRLQDEPMIAESLRPPETLFDE